MAVNEKQFLSLLQNVSAERHQFTALLKKHFGVDGLYTALCARLDVQPGMDEADYLVSILDLVNSLARHIGATQINRMHKSEMSEFQNVIKTRYEIFGSHAQ